MDSAKESLTGAAGGEKFATKSGDCWKGNTWKCGQTTLMILNLSIWMLLFFYSAILDNGTVALIRLTEIGGVSNDSAKAALAFVCIGQILVMISQLVVVALYLHWYRKGDGSCEKKLPCAHLTNIIIWFLVTIMWFMAEAARHWSLNMYMMTFWGWIITMFHLVCYLIQKKYSA